MDAQLLVDILDLAVAIQQIPAPTFQESERGAFIQSLFQAEGLGDVTIDEIGNVYGRLPGGGGKSPLVISAHLDTVFPESTDLSYVRDETSIHAPGIGDNALGVASLIGLARYFRGQKSTPHTRQFAACSSLPGDIWLVADVGEEGLGDLHGIRTVVDRFGGEPLAYVVLEGMALGMVYHRGLGVRRYRITAETRGGHSWVDYGRPSAIHELSLLINRLLATPVPKNPRTSMNIGTIRGGISVNAIASYATLELDLRSESSQILSDLANRVETLVEEAKKPEVKFLLQLIGDRPVGEIPADHPLVTLAVASLKSVGVKADLKIGSTDANVPLSRGLPAICIGMTSGGGAHTLREYIHIRPLEQGLRQLARVVEGIFQDSYAPV